MIAEKSYILTEDMNDKVVGILVIDHFRTLDGKCDKDEFLYRLKLIAMLAKIDAPTMGEKFKILDKLIAEGKEPKID